MLGNGKGYLMLFANVVVKGVVVQPAEDPVGQDVEARVEGP